MSIRVMADGRAYTRTQETRVRPYHQPDPGDPSWKCSICGEPWGWVYQGDAQTGVRREYRRHYPGTFWERD